MEQSSSYCPRSALQTASTLSVTFGLQKETP